MSFQLELLVHLFYNSMSQASSMFQILPNECGISLNHNIQALAAEKFAACGKIIALGLLQGSEAPHCFCKEVSDFLVYGAIKDPECAYMLKSIPDSEISGKLNQVSIEELYSMRIYPKYYNSFTTTFIFLSCMPVRMMQEFNNCSRLLIFRGCRRQPLYCFHFDFRYVTLVR